MIPYFQKIMTFEGRRIKIWYKREDKPDVFLNPLLIKKQKLTWLEVQGLLKTYKQKDIIIKQMIKTNPRYWLDGKLAIKYLKTLAKEVTKLEYRLQKLWHFKKNQNFHRFWDLPHCSCPKMDNEERWGTKHHIYDNNCIIHGK
jgi:hypothetical protein